MYMKKLALILSCLFLVTFFPGCSPSSPETDHSSQRTEILRIDNLQNGDSKFWNDGILTGNSEGAQFLSPINQDFQKKTCTTIFPSWMDAVDGENFVVYGTGERKVYLATFDPDFNLLSNHLVTESEDLIIDPALTKMDNTYYLSLTFINGTVNNSDPATPNGLYEIRLYKSNDLEHFEYVSTAASEQKNLEDVKLFVHNQSLHLVYEQEQLDKGKSAILLKTSEDNGVTFSEAIELLPETADQEPANLISTEAGWELFYSSDVAKPGQSYQGASAYIATYDEAFKLISKDERIPTSVKENLLLYDVKTDGDGYTLLYAEDYFGEKNLIVDHVSTEN